MRHTPLRHLLALVAAAALAACSSSGSTVVGGDAGGLDATVDVQCAAPQSACGGACVDTRTSAQHCGACGNACPAGQVCTAGACVQSCPGTQTLCNNSVCVSTDTDRAHCGACGNVCPAGQVCAMGRCALECGPMLALCGAQGDAGAGGAPYCANTRTDRDNCGACGNACAAGQVCTSGQCVLSCAAGTRTAAARVVTRRPIAPTAACAGGPAPRGRCAPRVRAS